MSAILRYLVITAAAKFLLDNLTLWTGVILTETEGWLQSKKFGNQYFKANSYKHCLREKGSIYTNIGWGRVSRKYVQRWQ